MVILPLYNQVKKALSQSEFVSSEGEFLTGKIFEAIENLDKTFLSSLLKEQTTKEHFFDKIDDAIVPNQKKLFDFFNAKEYFDSSFTSYTPKIGLIRKDSFIKKFDDTVLAWPYKDCVLEGGMSSEDAGKKEVFYNTIISKDEIDRLFEPKVLTNIKKYSVRPELVEGSTHGSTSSPRACEESIPTEITLDDNLILKGNNLLVLHSLKKRYIDQNGGMIKLIYIDPPYNTGNDGFKYNDRFNHSTWLTFMKNRLEAAKELLKSDGVIFVSIDDNEQAYLKVLMDEVFERDNFIGTLIWKRRASSALSENNFSADHEYVLAYKRSKFNNFAGIKKDFKNFKNPDNDPRGSWVTGDLTVGMTDKMRPNQAYDLINPDTGNIYPWNPNRVWSYIPESMKVLIDEKRIIFPSDPSKRPMLKRFKNDLKSNYNPLSTLLMDHVGLNTEATRLLQDLLGGNVFDYSKPLSLLSLLVRQVAYDKNDTILDFHAGSGTTAHAVLDLNKEDGGNRKFILVEQMDYIETVTSQRVKKVIERNGEGSFIYAELRETNDFNEADTIGRLNDNMRYLPIGEIDDESYGVSDEEKRLNKQFYGLV